MSCIQSQDDPSDEDGEWIFLTTSKLVEKESHKSLKESVLPDKSGFESSQEISIKDTEWPIETTLELVATYIKACSPDTDYADRLTARVLKDIGPGALHEGFQASLHSLLQLPATQSSLAALLQQVEVADADTNSLQFTSDTKRMRATYARIIPAIGEAIIFTDRAKFVIASVQLEKAINPNWTGGTQFNPKQISSDSGLDSMVLAIENSQALRSVYNFKVEAQETEHRRHGRLRSVWKKLRDTI